jgi:hypothetical protein
VSLSVLLRIDDSDTGKVHVITSTFFRSSLRSSRKNLDQKSLSVLLRIDDSYACQVHNILYLVATL